MPWRDKSQLFHKRMILLDFLKHMKSSPIGVTFTILDILPIALEKRRLPMTFCQSRLTSLSGMALCRDFAFSPV